MNIEELIKNEDYQKALKLLDKEDEYSFYYKALIFFKMGKYEESLILLVDALKLSNKYFYESTLLKIDCLIKLSKEKDALRLIEEELSMPYIPSNYEEEFNKRYKELINKNKDSSTLSIYDKMDNEELGKILLTSSSQEELLEVADQLSKRNVRLLMSYIKQFLISDSFDYIKSIFLEQLSLQGVNEVITVKKNNLSLEVYPSSLTPIMDLESKKQIEQIIDSYNESKNITLGKISLMKALFYISTVYPLDIEKEEYDYVALASFYIGCISLNIDINLEELVNKKELNKKILKNYIDMINN